MRSPLVPRAGTFSVGNSGRPRSCQLGALVMAPCDGEPICRKIARLEPSCSCRSLGITVGEHVQMALPQEWGRSLLHITATSPNVTELAVSRPVLPPLLPVAIAAPHPSMPCGL